jgi:hypothetical protein
MVKVGHSRYPSGGTLAAPGSRTRHPAWSPTAVGLVLLAGAIVLSTALVLVAGTAAWRWTDQHLLRLGLTTRQTQTVNRTELVRQIRAFQLVSVKQTYATRTQQTVSQAFGTGTSQVALPDWLAGEQMTVQGRVQVLAGVDLSQVEPDDIVVSRQGNDRHVQVRVPPAQVISTELVPNTLRVSTTAGLLTQLEQALGITDDQLRNRAADLLLQAGRDAAQQQGIEAAAAGEAERRLTGFLQSVPSEGGHTSYAVVVKQPPRR